MKITLTNLVLLGITIIVGFIVVLTLGNDEPEMTDEQKEWIEKYGLMSDEDYENQKPLDNNK